MEQLIAYRVMIPGLGPWHPLKTPDLHEVEHDDCTIEQWERQRKREVHERWKGTNYRVYLWPPQKWWKRGNDVS